MTAETNIAAQDRVLLIDDDVALCRMLQGYLSKHGWNVSIAHRASTGLAAAQEALYELIILDVMLPDFDGFEVLRRLRKETSVYVLLLTARGDDVDRIVGLELGADDYLPKPFNVRELLARMHAIVRRGPRELRQERQAQIEVAGFSADLTAREIAYKGQLLDLTDLEFELLHRFLERPVEVLSREDLVKHAFNRPFRPLDRSLDMLVLRVRRKLERLKDFRGEIRTIRSSGYMLLLDTRFGQ